MIMSIQEIIKNNYGFITSDMVGGVVAEDRLYPCVVRCGCGRFVCPAQDVRHFVDIITNDGTDYVRDVSLQDRGR